MGIHKYEDAPIVEIRVRHAGMEIEAKALIDTGAKDGIVSNKLVERLSLKYTGPTDVNVPVSPFTFTAPLYEIEEVEVDKHIIRKAKAFAADFHSINEENGKSDPFPFDLILGRQVMEEICKKGVISFNEAVSPKEISIP